MLTSSRAETLYIELLADTRLVTADPHEVTRAIAAEVLGVHGRSEEAHAALEAASKGRWKNSERVRAAATTAIKVWEERKLRDSEPPPPSSALGADLAMWEDARASRTSIRPSVVPAAKTEPPPPTSKR